jgi:hypothetical protein
VTGSAHRVLARFTTATKRIDAPNSVAAKPWKTKGRLTGIGPFTCEPTDGDDTFPPAIASYEVIDGWLVYHGRRGDQGVLAGSQRKLQEWAREVDDWVKRVPTAGEDRPWISSDGGAQHVREAIDAAQAMLRKGGVTAEIEVLVQPGATVAGKAVGNKIWLVNAHKGGTVQMIGGISLAQSAKTGAHEAAHLVYSHQPDKGRRVLELLTDREKRGEDAVSLYHALAGHFEGTMDAAAVYLLAGPRLRAVAQDVYDACHEWLG